MEIIDLTAASLTVLVFVLEAFNLFFGMEKRPEPENVADAGISMTIGGREVQEDQTGMIRTKAGIMAVLADGAGKMFGGRIAGKITVDTCLELFKDYNAFNNPQYYFRKAFHCANKEILKALQDESCGSASAGCVIIRDHYLYYAVVGNVKVCVFREGNLIPLSTGHTVSVLAEQRFGEGKISRQDALAVLENQRLFNYLGRDGFKDIELFDDPVRLEKQDIVVLMSDGVYDLLGFNVIEQVLEKSKSCQEKAFEIIELVNQHAGEFKDNASIILLGTEGGAGTV